MSSPSATSWVTSGIAAAPAVATAARSIARLRRLRWLPDCGRERPRSKHAPRAVAHTTGCGQRSGRFDGGREISVKRASRRLLAVGEVRARTVDVETGAPPAPLRPQNPDEVDFELAAVDLSTIKVAQTKASRRVDERHAEGPAPAGVVQSAPPPGPGVPTGRESGPDLLEQDGLLSLDEPSTEAAASRPWVRGLRG